jgi:hypothetical protein
MQVLRSTKGALPMKSYAEQCNYLRELAEKLRDISATTENAEKRRRWADHNDLLARQKPLIWVCPDDDGGWLELVPPSSLKCEDMELRALENRLLKYLYQAEYLPDDFVFEPCVYFDTPGNYTGYLYGNTDQKTAWGVPIIKPKVGQGAYHLDAFIREEKVVRAEESGRCFRREVRSYKSSGRLRSAETRYREG